MKKAHQNLRLIIPSKENELFSITKYKKKSSDILANSFFSTQYSLYNKIKYSFDSLINQRKFEKSLNLFINIILFPKIFHNFKILFF